MSINFKDFTEIIQLFKETSVPITALVIFVAVILITYKLLNTDGPLSQRVFRSKKPRWDTKIPLGEHDKLNQLLEDIKWQEVFRKLVGIDIDVSKIDLLLELKNNHPTKINYRIIRNAMSYLRFNNGAATVEITRKDKAFDIFLVVLFAIPIIGYFIIGIGLFIQYSFTKSQNSELARPVLLLLFLTIITMVFLAILRSSYLAAKRINKVMDENLKILIKETEN